MIRKIFILMFVIILPVCAVAADFVTETYYPSRLFLGVVIDSSPASDKAWNIRKSRAVELISSLKPGDKVVVVEARPGRPSVRALAVVGGPEKTGLNEVISSISVLGKELLSKADVARGVETVCDLFQTEGQGYHGCLVVLTNGRISNRQVRNILRMASTCSNLNHSVCFTCDPTVANQALMDAGKQKLLDIRFASNPRLVFWLQAVRESITPTTPLFTPPADNNDALADEKVPSEPEEPEQPEIHKPDITPDINATGEPCEPNELEEVPQTATGSSWAVILIVIVVLMMLSIAVILVGARLRKGSLNTSPTDSYLDSDIADDVVTHLKALIGDRDVDLGPLGMVSEFSIGSDHSCGLCIEDEKIAGKHAKVFRTRKSLKIENYDGAPISVDGVPIKMYQKRILNLPADIELVPGIVVSLYIEPIESEKEDN